KIAAVRAAIEAAGAQLFLLPPYSPDMNPIEMVFAKLKTLLRQAPERTATGSGDASVRFSTSSLQRSAPTTSKPPAMATHCENALGSGVSGQDKRAQHVVASFGLSPDRRGPRGASCGQRMQAQNPILQSSRLDGDMDRECPSKFND